MNEKILIVDRESCNREMMESLLGERGYIVSSVEGFDEALTTVRSKPFDLVITEMTPSNVAGLDFIREVKRICEDVEVIVFSGYATFDNIIQSMRAHLAFDFIPKPLTSIDRLFDAVNDALEIQRARRDKGNSGK